MNAHAVLLRARPALGRLVRAVLPASVAARLQSVAAPMFGRWEEVYVPGGWDEGARNERVSGWNTEAVRDSYLAKWPSFVAAVEGSQPLAISHEVSAGNPVRTDDVGAHNMIMSFAYVAALAAREAASLSVLDWGGGLGHYFLLTRALLLDVELDYHCKEVPLLAEAGEKLLPDVTFHTDERCLERTYDLVFASSSLQYSRDWPAALRGLAGATGKYLFVTRLPVVEGRSFVMRERRYAIGYGEYLEWIVGRQEFLDHANAGGLTLLREFMLADKPGKLAGTSERDELRGFLFAKGRPDE